MEFGIGLGSNIGDRIQHLREAVRMLEELREQGSDLLKAPLYETEPVDCPEDSGPFLNTVVVAHFPHGPAQLLELTQLIESRLGRPTKRARNAPRVVDLDLLYADDEQYSSDSLTLPHPKINSRRFVLEPLAWLRPQLVLPGTSASVQDLLKKLQSDEPPLSLHAEVW